MSQLFLSTFDQVLLDSDEAIPLSTMVEIDRIRRSHVKFGVISNRILKSVLDYNKDFPFLDYVIACDGAYVYDVVSRKVLYKKNVLASVVKKMWKMYSYLDIYFCTVKEWNLCRGEIVYSEVKKRNSSFLDFYQLNKESIYKVRICFTTKKERNNAYLELEELGVKAKFIKVDYRKQYMIDVVSEDVYVENGVEKICKREHVALEDVIYVGGREEDIPLLLSIGHSFCVSNGSRGAKKVATGQTSSNETKGVEKVIKKLF